MTTQEILRQAKDARLALQRADTEKKNAALLAMAEALVANTEAILAANAEDMAAAKALLKSTGRSIHEIAADTGFGNEKHFSTAFRRLEGLSPSEYRRRG